MIEIKKKLNEFFEDYIDSHIILAIRKLAAINDNHKTSNPYLALSFSGIDFFGGLEKEFKPNNRLRQKSDTNWSFIKSIKCNE